VVRKSVSGLEDEQRPI